MFAARRRLFLTLLVLAILVSLLALPALSQARPTPAGDPGAESLSLPAAPLGPGTAPDPSGPFPLMRPDLATIQQWIAQHNAAPAAPQAQAQARVQGSVSLLEYLSYVPAERKQGSCGNCWAWAGTAMVEIALRVQEGISDRLSLQWSSSCLRAGTGEKCVCCGESLHQVARWYGEQGYALPWANANAAWQDKNRMCTDEMCTASAVSCAAIGQTPRYPVRRMDVWRIETHDVSPEQAIANIKSVLDQQKAVYLTVFLPSSQELNWLTQTWQADPETMIWNPSFPRGKPRIPGQSAGHAMAVVGYDDTDPANRYWIVLNSWGTAYYRPHGLIRVAMDMDYGCYMDAGGGPMQSFHWQTLDVEFGESATATPTATAAPGVTVSPTASPTATGAPLPGWTIFGEAERGVVAAPMAQGADSGASACGYVASAQGGAGAVTLAFDLAAAEPIYPWARSMGLGWNQNSFFVSFDGGSEFVYEIPQAGGAWGWSWNPIRPVDQPVAPVALGAGPHTVRLRAREAGARFDAFWLTNRPDMVPEAINPCDAHTPTPSPTRTSTAGPTPTPTLAKRYGVYLPLVLR